MASSEKQKLYSMAAALLKRPLQVQPPEPEGPEGASPLKMITGFMFLAFNLAMAVSSWYKGFGAASLVAFSFLCLVMLFRCLRQYARTPPGSPRRELLKMAAWLLATMLTVTCFQLVELWFLAIGEPGNPVTDSETTPHDLIYSMFRIQHRF